MAEQKHEDPSRHDAKAPFGDLVVHEIAPEASNDDLPIHTHEICDEVTGLVVIVEVRPKGTKTRVTRVWTARRALSVGAQAGSGAAAAVLATHAFWPTWNAISSLWN